MYEGVHYHSRAIGHISTFFNIRTLNAKKDINIAQVYISFGFIVIAFIVKWYVWLCLWEIRNIT